LKLERVLVYFSNPMGRERFDFASEEDAKSDIEERMRWGELEKVVRVYTETTEYK